jgi:cytochrome c553
MRRFSTLASVSLCAVLLLSWRALAADQSGEQLFKSKCASCHGASGEGAKKYNKPLEGSLSVGQLAKLIGETMPESNPGSLSTREAETVAAYIHDAFYSQVARERNRPARIELARLTVRQYRQSVAELIGSFRQPPAAWGKQRGLRAEYFKGRNFNRNSRVLERIDPQVRFDFGTDPPVPEKIEPHEFLIRWNGSVLAPETGEYEFVVRTEHAARLWVNETNRPLIDAWVKSGNVNEYTVTLFLIGGRVYPLRLEYSKAKQGVDDSKNQKTKPPLVKSSIALLWKRPQRAIEPIPSRQLSPNASPELFICSTAFPPDDRSYGWERGTTVSKAWDQATTDAALEVTAHVASRLNELAGTKDDATDRSQKLRAFCRAFAECAFRQPLSAEQAQVLIDKQFAAAKDAETAVKRVVLLVLKSPRFLYREVGGSAPGFDVAARLSFGLWDSLPDKELLAAAANGKLATKEQVARQAERMLADPRARAKIRGFLLNWVKADNGRDLSKDPKKFPGFDAALATDLRTSLELFLDDVVWSEKSDFRQMLLSDELFLNARLKEFYGADLPAEAEFTKVKLDSDRRAGVLTHPYLMSSFAHSGDSSPIHRGVFLARGVLAMSLRPPPEAVAPLAPDLHPTLTTRERVTWQTNAKTCMTCHGVINPLGFTLEHFDAVGRYRDQDHGKPVDATGSYRTRSGNTVTLNNARELATFLAGSEEVHTAFVEQMFHYFVQQPVRAYGPNMLDELRKSFAANGFNIRKLAVEVMGTSVLSERK